MRRKKLSNDELSVLVQSAIGNCDGYDGDELASMRADAIDYYYGRSSAAPSVPGRSSQQSSDVADMVEAVLAQVLPAFEIDSVAEFEPIDAQDEDQAAAETDAVNYVIMELNRGYFEFSTAIKDALLLRNGLVKVWIDEKIDTKTHQVEGATDLEVDQLSNASQPNHDIAVTEAEQRDDGLWDLEVVETITTRDLKVTAVDVTTFGWTANHASIFLQDCAFCYQRTFPTRSDLVEKGYKKSIVDTLAAVADDKWVDTRARNPEQTETNPHTSDFSMQHVEHYECYGRFDVDGDGVAELIKVCISGTTILERYPADIVPYASGTPFLRPHRFNGLSLFDKLRGVQDSKTAVLRQWADNQNHANNSRVIAVDGQVNLDDATNSRPGGIVRARAPGMVEPFPFTDVGLSCQNMLTYQDKLRSERGGASLDLQAAGLQIAGDTAHGVERQMTAREQLAAMITRTLAETLVRSVYQLVHDAMRLYMPDPMPVRAHGQFTEVNPAKWRQRARINIRAGLSTAERYEKKAALEFVIARQEAMYAAGYGGIMVNPSQVHNATIDHARASGIDNPERYWLDPASEESQQAAKASAQSAQQQQQQAAEYQDKLLQLQIEVEATKAKQAQDQLKFEEWKQKTDLLFKYWDAKQDAEIKEAELIGGAAVNLGSKAISLVPANAEAAGNGRQ